MSPVNLGARPSNSPLHVGVGNTKSGYGYGIGEINYNNTVAAGAIKDAATGGVNMRFSIQGHAEGALVTCMATNIWRSPDAVWSAVVWGMKLSPADLNGQSDAYCYQPLHGHQVWQHSRVMHTFYLGAGYYDLYQWFYASTNNNQIVYTGPDYQQLQAIVTSVGHL